VDADQARQNVEGRSHRYDFRRYDKISKEKKWASKEFFDKCFDIQAYKKPAASARFSAHIKFVVFPRRR